MKTFVLKSIRSISAVIIGLLLIKYSETAVSWLTTIIGIIFFASGLVGCLIHFSNRRYESNPDATSATDTRTLHGPWLIIAIGSMALGAILALFPDAFLTAFSYILSAVLIVVAIDQLYTLAAATRTLRIGLVWWLSPIAVMLVGIIGLIKPSLLYSFPLQVIGWAMILMGVTEILNNFKLYMARKQLALNNKKDESEVKA